MAGEFLGPRLSRRDIADLSRASDALAAAAQTIQAARPAWAPGAVHAIITANDIVVRIHARGERAIARYADKTLPAVVVEALNEADQDESETDLRPSELKEE